MKTLLATLTFLCLASPAFAANPASPLPQVKATATQHGVTLTWNQPNPAVEPTGSLVFIYRGSASGAESSTPINSTGIPLSTPTAEDSAITASTTYWYVAKICAPSGSTQVCSAPSNEVSVTTLPLAQGDFVPISGFSGSAH